MSGAFPKEFKHFATEVVDFSSDICAKGQNDLTCTFPGTHKYEVHHFNVGHKIVTVDDIEQNCPRSVKYFFRKANTSAA